PLTELLYRNYTTIGDVASVRREAGECLRRRIPEGGCSCVPFRVVVVGWDARVTAALRWMLRSNDGSPAPGRPQSGQHRSRFQRVGSAVPVAGGRSEEHTSELQSRFELVCPLLLT